MKAMKSVGISPAYGQVTPSSPVFFFDFHDGVRAGGNPTDVDDRSDNYFNLNTGRQSLDLSGAVGTLWNNDPGTFDFNSGTPHYFDEGVDTLESDYAQILLPENWGVVFFWWRMEVDNTSNNMDIIRAGGTANQYGFRLQYNGPGVGLNRLWLSDGGGTPYNHNQNVGTISTSNKYNVCVAIDRANRTHQWWQDGVAGDQQSLNASAVLANNDSTDADGRRFIIGTDMADNGSTTLTPFDGHLQRIGGINLPADTTVDFDTLAKRLHARNQLPGPEFEGI